VRGDEVDVVLAADAARSVTIVGALGAAVDEIAVARSSGSSAVSPGRISAVRRPRPS
jgi:hypothetical protein